MMLDIRDITYITMSVVFVVIYQSRASCNIHTSHQRASLSEVFVDVDTFSRFFRLVEGIQVSLRVVGRVAVSFRLEPYDHCSMTC